ncbi:MAG: DUF192 domain-containing protein [Candidatus Staskawiczbacteria bacterium]
MKMFLQLLLIIIFIIVSVYLSFYFASILLAPKHSINSFGSVCFGEKCFQVELAKTPLQREKGLMNRERLDKDRGMLFIFDKDGIYPFWMKNTLIPLDIIWINSNNEVVFISQNAQPCKSLICTSVFPDKNAKYVLEINGGLCKENNFKVGDILNIKLN